MQKKSIDNSDIEITSKDHGNNKLQNFQIERDDKFMLQGYQIGETNNALGTGDV